ncbi:MAG: FtsX-like permease family protein [Proteobacteria bacterium]|nr:MAG: FtsX-like permease family protein [Pseudomonadota bacterium]
MGLFWRIAFRNLFRNGRRNLLTGTSITLGLVGIGLLGGYLLRMERYLAAQSVYLNLNGHVIAYAKGGLDRHLSDPIRYGLDPSAQATLTTFGQDPRVALASPLLKTTGLLSNGCVSFPFSAQAVPPASVAWAREQAPVQDYLAELAQVTRGRGFWQAGPGAVNLSPRLAGILGKERVMGERGSGEKAGVYDCALAADREALRQDPSVQLVGQAFGGGLALADGAIAGWVSSGMAFQDDTALFLSLADAQAAYQTDYITAETFYLKDERSIPGFVRDLKAHLAEKNLAADVYPFYAEEISPFYVGGMQFNWVMLYLFLALVCSVVAISISNSLYISLIERRAELGTLLALGFPRRAILRLLLLEHALLVGFSLIPGLLITLALRAFVHSRNIRFLIPGLSGDLQFRLHLTPGFVVVICVVLLALVLLVTRIGASRFLKRPILGLLGSGV